MVEDAATVLAMLWSSPLPPHVLERVRLEPQKLGGLGRRK